MSGRFAGKWPVDRAGNPLATIKVLPDTHKFKAPVKVWLSTVGDAEWERAKGHRKTLIEPGSENENLPQVKPKRKRRTKVPTT